MGIKSRGDPVLVGFQIIHGFNMQSYTVVEYTFIE